MFVVLLQWEEVEPFEAPPPDFCFPPVPGVTFSLGLPPCKEALFQRRAREGQKRGEGTNWLGGGRGGEGILTKLSNSGFEEKSGFSART